MYSNGEANKLFNAYKSSGNKQENYPKKETDRNSTTLSPCLESTAIRERLIQSTGRRNSCNLSARCINALYHVAGNLCQSGAAVGAVFLTIADLNDRQKDAIGGITIGLIALGTFCFWQLSCCPHQNEESVSDSSYSGIHMPTLGSDQVIFETETETETESDSV